MNYYIAVEIETVSPPSTVAASLQLAYNHGTVGDFQVLNVNGQASIVLFERNATEDAEYVAKLAKKHAVTIQIAAMIQLADELDEGRTDEAIHLRPLIDKLRAHCAQCFDFGNGAWAVMQSHDQAPEWTQARVELALAALGYRMEESLATFDGGGHAILSIATGELMDENELPAAVIQLAESWTNFAGVPSNCGD